MTTIKLLGPATITHDSTDIGKTYGGGALKIIEIEKNEIASFYKKEKIAIGVEGTINLFQLDQSVTVSGDMTLYDYAEVVITLPYGTITLYKAKLFLPDSITLGDNTQHPFTLRISGGANASGKVYKIN